MAIVSQISNSGDLFSDTGSRVITTNSSVTANGSVSQTDQEGAEELQQQFLQILLTQLQNQNPLDPVDTTEYTNQLVQYSSLEQQIDTNLRLSSILDSLQISSSFSAFSYIGNDVQIATDMTVAQNDIADWDYALASDADAVEVKILNETGTVVYESNLGALSSGTYNLAFDINETNVPINNGEVLTVQINAVEDDGSEVDVETVTNIRVDSVETGASGDIVLRAGGLYFGVNDILKISQSSTVGTDPASENSETTDDAASS